MAKKILWILLAIVLVMALAAAAGLGFAWYQNNHIFVEDAVYPIDAQELDLRGQDISFAHYDAVHSQLPSCVIYWDVPFQGGKYSNDTQVLSVSDLTEKDIQIIVNYFPRLKTLDASGCGNYAILEEFQRQKPDCEVIYEVTLGGKSFAPDVTELTLENGDYDYDTLLENLPHLPNVQSVHLKMPELTLEQIDALKAAFGNIRFSCTVEIGGVEYETDTTSLDLSGLSSGDVAAVSDKLGMLPQLQSVELMKADGTTNLTKQDVKALKEAAPGASFHYTFDFYGTTVSTTDEEVHIKNKNIGDEGLDDVRLTLDLMENCSRFVLENCRITYSKLAEVRDEYRDKTKVVWRVEYGGGSCLTDSEVIRCTYELTDKNAQNLVYCEDMIVVDVGHKPIENLDWLYGMPHLQFLILADTRVSDITPIGSLKELIYLELDHDVVRDYSPLLGCTALQDVNVAYTNGDAAVFAQMPWLKHLWVNCTNITPEARQLLTDTLTDTVIEFDSGWHMGNGWRDLDNYYIMRDLLEMPYYDWGSKRLTGGNTE